MSTGETNKWPPRVWIRFKQFSEEIHYTKPLPKKHDDKNLRLYLSIEEHEALVLEARAKAFEEAILMANARRKKHNNSLPESLRLAAEAARGEK